MPPEAAGAKCIEEAPHQLSVRHSPDVHQGARKLGRADRLRSRLRGISAFISLLLPATAILFGVGGLVGATGIEFWPIWLAAASGAATGDWLSYWLGRRYKSNIAQVWPLSRHPDLLPRGEAFFREWGTAGIFFSHFFGPLRSAAPLVAGICSMPIVPFQIANVASALVWATGILTPGVVGVRWLL